MKFSIGPVPVSTETVTNNLSCFQTTNCMLIPPTTIVLGLCSDIVGHQDIRNSRHSRQYWVGLNLTFLMNDKLAVNLQIIFTKTKVSESLKHFRGIIQKSMFQKSFVFHDPCDHTLQSRLNQMPTSVFRLVFD